MRGLFSLKDPGDYSTRAIFATHNETMEMFDKHDNPIKDFIESCGMKFFYYNSMHIETRNEKDYDSPIVYYLHVYSSLAKEEGFDKSFISLYYQCKCEEMVIEEVNKGSFYGNMMLACDSLEAAADRVRQLIKGKNEI